MQEVILQTTKAQSIVELEPFLDDWRRLANSAPMRTPEWLLTWWEIYATPGDELSILLCHEPGGDLVGLAPLYLDAAGSLKLLGSGEVFTSHTTWLCDADWDIRVGIEVARYLQDCWSGWKRLLFESVDSDAIAIHATIDTLAQNGCLQCRRQVHNCWKIPLPATWDDYLRMLSQSLRKRCRKLQRQFFDSGIIRLCQVDRESDLPKGLEVLFELHGARWGSTEKPLGVFDDKRFRTFHETVARKLLTSSQLRLAWIECNGRPIAVEYQFVGSRAVYAYQSGIDLSGENDCSPGKLTMMAAIRFAISRGCEHFDLLSGDEPYKANWRAVPLACYDLRVWPERSKGRLEWLLWSGYTMTVRWLKPFVPTQLFDRKDKFVHCLKKLCITLRRGNRWQRLN